MQLLFCDICGRPVSEGAIARGEAFERDGETICKACELKSKSAKLAVAAAKGPLAHYEQTVWKCKSCGIPINALDLIEGRAVRMGEDIECVRCKSSEVARPLVAPAAAAPPRPVRAAGPITVPPRSSRGAAVVNEIRREERRPVLPIILICIILPMFALSLWYAVSAQQKLNEFSAKSNNSGNELPRVEKREPLVPQKNGDESVNKPAENPAPEKPPSKVPEKPTNPVIDAGLLDDLAAIEKSAAEETIKKLESRDLAVVWEGLIEAGSRRLIATRKWVRALLRDSDARTRSLACRVCGMLDDAEALGEITKLAESDVSGDVRDAAHLARARLLGKATRELKDMTPEELDRLRKEIEEEIKRQKPGAKND